MNCLLDAGAFNCKTFGSGGQPAFVILGPEFETLAKGGDAHKGAYFRQAPGNPPFNYAELKDAYDPLKGKGLLGGLTVPPEAKVVVELVRRGQLGQLEPFAQRLPDQGALGDFKKELVKRIEALRVSKRELFDKLEKDGKKWGAYKVGASYLRVYTQAKDRNEVSAKVGALQNDPEVRKNLEAQQVFASLLSQIYGPTRNPAVLAQAKATFQQFIDKYKDTEFATLAGELAK
ncbi:MAG TPA: hypothetical protein PK280_10235 [Planctomycetota bacterium]|nr:hypothetical protein [Planctomycetota bacterium]